MQTLPAVTLTGNPQTISLATQSPVVIRPGFKLRLANESYYAIQVSIGGAIHWLNPWTADVFEVQDSIGQIFLQPSLLISPAPATLSSNLLITIAEQGENIPGSYPMTLPRQLSTWTQPTELAVISAPGGGATKIVNVTPPSGTVTIGYGIDNLIFSGNPLEVLITGGVSGVTYRDDVSPSAPPAIRTALLETADIATNGLQIQFTPPLLFGAAIHVLAWSVPIVDTTLEPAPSWQAANQYPFRLNIAPAAGVETTLITGVAGQQVRLFQIFATWTGVGTAAYGAFRDSNGTYLANWDQRDTGPYNLQGYGLPLVKGRGVTIINESGVNATFFHGWISYSQG